MGWWGVSIQVDDNLNKTLLLGMLQIAVLVEVERLRNLPLEEIIEHGRACADVVASQGDIIQFKSKRKGDTAKAFAKLATGVAACSFLPGGIKFLDHQWVFTPEMGLQVTELDKT